MPRLELGIPFDYKSTALPIVLHQHNAPTWTRTRDYMHIRHVLYQLSYWSINDSVGYRTRYSSVTGWRIYPFFPQSHSFYFIFTVYLHVQSLRWESNPHVVINARLKVECHTFRRRRVNSYTNIFDIFVFVSSSLFPFYFYFSR